MATLAIVLAVMAGGIVWNYHEVRQLPDEIREERLAIEAAVDRLEGLTKRLEQINVTMHAEGGDATVNVQAGVDLQRLADRHMNARIKAEFGGSDVLLHATGTGRQDRTEQPVER